MEAEEDGPDEAFVARCYETLLGRAPDQSGLGHYTARLRDGHEVILTSVFVFLEKTSA
jgi:Domain of unknown function (DUF4214)